MSKKKKFKPVITRVKLNPEQAVLQCSCYNQQNYAPVNNASGNWTCIAPGTRGSTIDLSLGNEPDVSGS